MIIGFKETYPFEPSRQTEFIFKITHKMKIHTFRQDRKKRLKEGMKLQMSTGIRTKDYFCFKDDETIVAKQQVLMIYDPVKNNLSVTINRRRLNPVNIAIMVSNDGFDSRQDFIKWFFPLNKKGQFINTMWAGFIIHWTEYKY